MPHRSSVPSAKAQSDTSTRRAQQVRILRSILNIEASHLALSKTENVSDRLVFKPVRLPLERFAFEIADGLLDFCDDRAILEGRLDVLRVECTKCASGRYSVRRPDQRPSTARLECSESVEQVARNP